MRTAPTSDHHHAVGVLIDVQRPMPVPAHRLVRLGLAVHAAPAADDHLDMLRGPGPAHREQPFFGFRRGDPGQRTDLGIRQLTAGERLPKPRHRTQCARHASVLPRGAQLEPDTPGEPVGARVKPIAPAAARVELPDEVEQPRSSGVEMRGEPGDLIAESLELNVVRMSWEDARTIDVHRRFASRRLYWHVHN
jgi:hypothetical protein